MTSTIHVRLTAWYAAAVVVSLAVGAVVVAQVQTRFARNRLDADLHRLELTVAAVLHNEFGEGLDLAGAVREASMEVAATDRTIAVSGPDGETLAVWGDALTGRWRPPSNQGASRRAYNTMVDGTAFRVTESRVTDGTHSFDIAVMAPLRLLTAERAELLWALTAGVLVALAVALLGGWVLGRRALRPLSDLALQSEAITDHDPSGRLRPPNAHDELGRLASAFNALLDRLSTALTSQRQFMADASHQLRTPVSIVRTTAQVILRQEHRSEAEYRESMAIVGEQAARLARLVDGMFLLSRADANARTLAAAPCYVDELVSECVRGLSMIAGDRGVRIDVRGATDISLTGDEELLRQMLLNVLENAVRHTARGGVVRASVASTNGVVTIEIEDQGPGIAAADRHRIFERFVRLESGSDGAGLGLPIARWIANAHGGDVSLAASSDRGSTFIITVPSARDIHEGTAVGTAPAERQQVSVAR